ncbi:hypothetical protein HNP40_003029 [Mycobacteroides chelonae]|nr:hypothetical protein [Mycobacteroides chelonae]
MWRAGIAVMVFVLRRRDPDAVEVASALAPRTAMPPNAIVVRHSFSAPHSNAASVWGISLTNAFAKPR